MKGLKFMMLGAPGAGKGTQAKKISKRYEIPQISTGDMLREAKAEKTEMGKEAQRYMDAGELVPDKVVIGIVEERLKKGDAKRGYIFDGFPRTIEQARALEEEIGVELDEVFNVVVAEGTIVERLSSRRTCPKCGAMYHLKFSPPKEEGECDEDGTELIQRADDEPEVIRRRLKEYEEKTKPLVEYYRKKGKLKDIDGEKKAEEVFEQIVEWIEGEE